MSSTIFTGAAQIVTSAGSLDSCVLTDAALAISNGQVVRTGSESSLRAAFPDAELVEDEEEAPYRRGNRNWSRR